MRAALIHKVRFRVTSCPLHIVSITPMPNAAIPATARKPELLAPAGGRAQLEAAVWAGADAVYFGLADGLNARVRATSFTVAELSATMDYLHERGVRGYLALNTLVFDEELATATAHIRAAAHAGVDALIVQDIGLARLARTIAPALPLHASTQMSITDADGVAFAHHLGVRRVVLGRELSLAEIARVCATTTLDVEVFVHGALCVSYSGQCFSSEAWGGRSANRGQCAQACRLPYDLIVDGQIATPTDLHYLLSPQDLMALEQLPGLLHAGVRSLKIEGRLKGPEYVIATVTAYRAAIDDLWSQHQSGAPLAAELPRSTAQRRRLAQVFSRGQGATADGLSPGFLTGPQHQSLVIGRNPRHRGVFVGTVTGVTARGVRLELQGPIKRGDGVVFDHARPQSREMGGNVHLVLDPTGHSRDGEPDRGPVELVFGTDFDAARVHPGDLIWRTRDSAQDAGTHFDPQRASHPIAVDVQISGGLGTALRLCLRDADGHEGCVRTAGTLVAASGGGLDDARLAKAIGQLGDTPFMVSQLHNALDRNGGPLFIAPGEIKAARRTAVTALLAARRAHHRDDGLDTRPVLTQLLPQPAAVTATDQPAISLLCRSKAQVEAALAVPGIGELVLDFLEVHGLKEACAWVREQGLALVVAAPRVFKPGEDRLWRHYCRLAPDALLLRSPGLLWRLQQLGGAGAELDDGAHIPALHGDFSLNAANLLTVSLLLQHDLRRLTLTHDLNADQVAALLRGLPAAQRACIELIAHHHLPIFHTEYCAFARFLSDGNSYRDCGRPCETHRLHMRDSRGADHLLLADIGCRNTVFNAAAQSAAPVLGALRDAGLQHIRIELVDEPGDEVAGIVGAYQELLAGRIDAKTVWHRLGHVIDANGHAQGVALGSLTVRAEPPRASLKMPTAR